MWKAQAASRTTAATKSLPVNGGDDDWETDADFVNDVSEREQLWGAKTVQGSGRIDAVNIEKLRDDVKKDDESGKQKEYENSEMKPSVGYGGKFGVQKDRVDKSAVGFEYQAQLEKHTSQKDYSQGFGGKYGVNTDRKDKSALGFDHIENVPKHSSQVDHSKGFGGKFGVNTDRKDQSAVGFDHVEKLTKHSSQVDYAKGFGGKYGVNTDRKDSSALGFDHVENVPKHSSQVDYAKGFGGKYGVEKTMDKSACKFEEDANQVVGTNYQRTRADSKTDVKDIKSRFENQEFGSNEESKKRAEEIRTERMNKDKKDKELESRFQPSEAANSKPEDAKPKPIGRISINNAFLGNQQSEPSAKPKAEPAKVNKITTPINSNTPFNRFSATGQVAASTLTAPSVPAPEAPKEETNGFHDKHVEVQQPAVQMPMPTPTYYNNEPEPVNNDDEWNDDDSPPKIQPILAPPVQQYMNVGQEEYSSINEGNNYYENFENENHSSSMPYVQTAPTNGNENSSKGGRRAIALYDFAASEPDELSFDPQDVITNIQMLDEGWWQGACNGNFGLFPSNYVQLLED